jgi:hypothetical protein
VFPLRNIPVFRDASSLVRQQVEQTGIVLAGELPRKEEVNPSSGWSLFLPEEDDAVVIPLRVGQAWQTPFQEPCQRS